MLTDAELRLLAAAADGELSARDDRAVRRLLARSADARRLLAGLRADAGRLRALPRPRLGEDLSGHILGEITARHLTPRPRPAPAASAAWSRVGLVANLAAAAAVVLAVGVGGYLIATAPGPARPVAAKPKPPGKAVAPAPKPRPASDAANALPEPEPEPLPEPAETPVAVEPPPAKGDAITAPAPPPPQLVEVAVQRRPALIAARDLGTPAGQDRLAAALAGGPVRVDVFCADTHAGLDPLRQAVQKHGVRWLLDPAAAERHRRRLPARYAAFTDALTAAELAAAFQGLSAGPFDSVVVTPVTDADRKELAALCGSDPLRPARPAGPLGHDPRKPLAEATAEQLAEALRGQGGSPSVKAALVSTSPPAPSVREARKAFDARVRVPGAVPVLVVLREMRR